MSEGLTLRFPQSKLRGVLRVPGDKSISHRAVMLGAIAEGRTTISGFLPGEDCLHTIEIFQQLGVKIVRNGTDVFIESPGIQNWQAPNRPLYAGNSGTTARLLLGILAGSTITSTIEGDESLSKRPMNRVIRPLQLMGSIITGENDGNLLPLTVVGSPLKGIEYEMPVASAQVKSAILFAGLQAEGTTTVHESTKSRDHTERMLEYFGVNLNTEPNEVSIRGVGTPLQGGNVQVPGDISSAAFFMAACAMIEGSVCTFTHVGLNPTRTGILEVLREMGAKIIIQDERFVNGEPIGTVQVAFNQLQGTIIEGSLIPRLIDELPIISLLATQAKGTTIIKDAAELRVKETDRIAAVTNELIKLGAIIEATEDGMIIQGPTRLSGGNIHSYGDHRIGMMAAIVALIASEPITIEDPNCIGISYPNFFSDLESIIVSST